MSDRFSDGLAWWHVEAVRRYLHMPLLHPLDSLVATVTLNKYTYIWHIGCFFGYLLLFHTSYILFCWQYYNERYSHRVSFSIDFFFTDMFLTKPPTEGILFALCLAKPLAMLSWTCCTGSLQLLKTELLHPTK